MRHYVYKIGGNVMYIIDTKKDDKYFIVTDLLGKSIKIAKSCNTLEDVKKFVGLENIQAIIEFNVDDVYPIGAIYISIYKTSPATLFGGTWENIASANPTTNLTGIYTWKRTA